MSILQTTNKPVRVLRSTDTGAPQLSAAVGSLKTVLKACLKTGYGQTAALGWEMPFEDSAAAVFHSKDATATGCRLKVHHDRARAAVIRGYHSMTSLTAGTNEYQRSSGNFQLMQSNKDTADWVLVGHEKAFIFILLNVNEDAQTTSKCLFFGDFPSYAAADKLNNLLWHTDNRTFDYIYANRSEPVVAPENYDANFSFRLAASADQLTPAAHCTLRSRCFSYYERSSRAYPDPITGGLQADALDLHERIGNKSHLRGVHPGLLYCSHDISIIPDGTVLDAFDGTTDRFMKFGLNFASRTHHQLLVNITSWVA